MPSESKLKRLILFILILGASGFIGRYLERINKKEVPERARPPLSRYTVHPPVIRSSPAVIQRKSIIKKLGLGCAPEETYLISEIEVEKIE